MMYWSDRGAPPVGNSINKVSLENLKAVQGDAGSVPGKDYELLAENFHETIGITVDKKTNHIYTADLGGTVYQLDLNGDHKKIVYDKDGAISGMTLAYI
jgi:hypothetical protein